MGTRITTTGAEKVYQAASLWVERALKSDDSLFTPGTPIWSSRWLGELHERFMNQPDAGDRSFLEKLRDQLAQSPPEIYQLMGEVLYVHFLIVTARKSTNEQRRIDEVLGWSSQPVAIPPDLVACLTPGLASPGQNFHTSRPFHVGFLIEFVEQWKEQSPEERNRLLSDAWAFKDFVIGINFRSILLQGAPNRPRTQREALLHLVFPDTFEAIVSANHKRQIAKAFSNFVTQPTDDIDRQLEQIRAALEPTYGEGNFFYKPEVKYQWSEGLPPPTDNLWSEFVRLAQAYVDSGRLETEEINYKREMGKDLVAARSAVLDSASNWHELLQYALRTRKGHPINWMLLDDFNQWCSGYREQALAALQTLWGESSVPVAERIRAFVSMSPNSPLRGKGSAYGSSMSVISGLLMGLDIEQYPPFRTGVFDKAYVRTRYEKPEPSADEATLYEHALGFLDRFIEEADGRGLKLRHRLDAQSVVWGVVSEDPPEEEDDDPIQPESDLKQLAAELYLPAEFLEEINNLLEEKKQVIFQGPPGTGKTYVAQELAKHLAGKDRVTLVQFHPSYAYEDFVQGYRPKTADGGQVAFELQGGPLLRIAERAEKDPSGKYYLIIDEINRGIIAKVFGELYFLLEYRDRNMNLQYSDMPFSLPSNLYIIGTMNTADRSIALVDLALRRRFYFVEFHPNEWPINDLLRNWLKDNASDMAWVVGVVDRANEELNDRNAAIGPSHFMKDNLDEAKVERIWKHSILPYVEEHLFREDDVRSRFSLDALRRPDASSDDADGSDDQADGVSDAST